MERAQMERRLDELAEPLARVQGLELVDLEFRSRGRKALVRVFLDRPGGITIDQIADFSREFGTVLDVEDPIPQAYTLEVSSPGLTRSLKKPREFRWAQGRAVRVQTREPVDGARDFVGRLAEAGDEEVTIEDSQGRHTIPLTSIAKANLEYVGESDNG